MRRMIKMIASYLKRMPDRRRNRIFELALLRLPLWFIRRIPCSYSTYLACYTPQKGDVVLDCGAHIGNCALLFSRLVGEKGLVIAAEPLEKAFHTLQGRIQRLGLKNVLAVKKGVWNQSTQQALWVSESTLSNRLLSGQEATGNTGPTDTVDCITIDDITDSFNLKRLDLVKMDIEGAEIEALEGSRDTINRFMPNIAIASYHMRDGQQTSHRLETFLSDRGYRVRTFFQPHLTTCARRPPQKDPASI
ncbi:FkbM family methyltransferase [Thermodesulfobacteriota bacterium]